MSSPSALWLRRALRLNRRSIQCGRALIVDAGMRALWYSGCMPYRVRMPAAPPLAEDLLPARRTDVARFGAAQVAFAAIKPGAAGCGAG